MKIEDLFSVKDKVALLYILRPERPMFVMQRQ